jgi:hypothetical protein
MIPNVIARAMVVTSRFLLKAVLVSERRAKEKKIAAVGIARAGDEQ